MPKGLVGTFSGDAVTAFIEECGYEEKLPRYKKPLSMLADGMKYTVEATEGGGLYRVYASNDCPECGKQGYLIKGICGKCWGEIKKEKHNDEQE